MDALRCISVLKVLSCENTCGRILLKLQISMQCTPMSELWNSSIVSWQSWGWRREETRPAICMVTAPGQHRPAPAWDGITKLSFNQRRQPALELLELQCPDLTPVQQSRQPSPFHCFHASPSPTVCRTCAGWQGQQRMLCLLHHFVRMVIVLRILPCFKNANKPHTSDKKCCCWR